MFQPPYEGRLWEYGRGTKAFPEPPARPDSPKTYTPWFTPYYPYVPHQCSCLDSLTEAWYQYQVWLAKPGNYDRDIGPMENYSFWKFMEYRKFVEFTKKRKK